MSDDSKIEWTDATWNPIRGCSRVSEGCRHCYAERVAARFSGPGQPYEGLAVRKLRVVADDEQTTVGRWTGTVRMVPEHLADPLRWRRPRRVFVNSMSDLFHESLTNEQIAAVFGVMAASPRHTFQVLTKRARRMREWFEWVETATKPYGGLPDYADHRHERAVCCRCAWMVPGYEIDHAGAIGLHPSDDVLEHQSGPWPLPNVWLGVSVENQAAADERIPELLRTPAAVRWISAEPLLGPVQIGPVGLHYSYRCKECGDNAVPESDGTCHDCGGDCELSRDRLDWCVMGAESGPGARAADPAWFRSLAEQCRAARVPVFFKQAVAGGGVTAGPESIEKRGGLIGLPYLDGRQHKDLPK